MFLNTSALQRLRRYLLVLALMLMVVGGATGSARAGAPLPQNPQSGSVGLEGTISSPPPSRAATITNPTNGRSFNSLPIVVSGLCPEGNLVKIFSNNIFLGSTECRNGTFTLNVDLFNGQNDLVARVYDSLDQAGPDSNTVRVNFADPQFAAFGGRVSLTSNYARLGADPGKKLVWPIILSGGTGPYALSVDWGDGKPLTLRSVPFAGNIDIDHVYDAAGIYRIVVKATDSNGTTAYLQLVGIANGAASAAGKTASGKDNVVTITKTRVILWPSIVALFLVLLAFWVGRRYELLSLRKRIERSAGEY